MPRRSNSASIASKTISAGKLLQEITARAAIRYSVMQTLLPCEMLVSSMCTRASDNHVSGRSRVRSGGAATVSRQGLRRSSVAIDPEIAFVRRRIWPSRRRWGGPRLTRRHRLIVRIRTLVQILPPQQTRVVRRQTQQARSSQRLQVWTCTLHPLDAPGSSGPASDDLVHS